MEAILEFLVIFFLGFRWFLLFFGMGLIIVLVYLKARKQNQPFSWPMILGILTAIAITLISLYNIIGIDYGLALPPNFR